MNNDITSKIILDLDAKPAIKEAKKVAPELQEALSVKVDDKNTGVKQLQNELRALGNESARVMKEINASYNAAMSGAGYKSITDKYNNALAILDESNKKVEHYQKQVIANTGMSESLLKNSQAKLQVQQDKAAAALAQAKTYEGLAKSLLSRSVGPELKQLDSITAQITAKTEELRQAYSQMGPAVSDTVEQVRQEKDYFIEGAEKVAELTNRAKELESNIRAAKKGGIDNAQEYAEWVLELKEVNAQLKEAEGNLKRVQEVIIGGGKEETGLTVSTYDRQVAELSEKIEQIGEAYNHYVMAVYDVVRDVQENGNKWTDLETQRMIEMHDQLTHEAVDLERILTNLGEAIRWSDMELPSELIISINEMLEGLRQVSPYVSEYLPKGFESVEIHAQEVAREIDYFNTLLESGAISDPQTIENINNKLVKLSEELLHLKAVFGEDVAGSDPLVVIEEEAEQTGNTISDLIAKIQDLKAQIATIESGEYTGEDAAEKYRELNIELSEAQAEFKGYKKAVQDTAEKTDEYEKELEETAEATKKVRRHTIDLSKIFSIIKKGFDKLSGSGSRAIKSFESSLKGLKGVLKRGLSNITRYVLGFRNLFYLVRKLREAAKEGLDNLARFNDGSNRLNTALTELQSSLLFIKNAWGAAFEPVISYVMPVLTKLLDLFAELGNAVARFIGALTGQGTVFQAVKVQAQDYADSLDSASGSAGKASKAADKLKDRLAAFDDLNVLGKDDENPGSGSGGGGGSGNKFEYDYDTMFTEVVPFSKAAEMVQEVIKTLQEAWAAADFTEIGSTISQKLQDALYSIDWEEIKTVVGRIGLSVGTFLNGLLGNGELFRASGHTIAEALNTITIAIYGFLDAYEQGSLAESLSAGFSQFFNDVEWDNIGITVSNGLDSVITEASKFLETFPTDKLFESLNTLIENIDWDTLGKNVGKLLGDAINFSTVSASKLTEAFSGLVDKIDISEIVESAASNIDWLEVGESLLSLLWSGIKLAFKASNWAFFIGKGLWSALVKGFYEMGSGGESAEDFNIIEFVVSLLSDRAEWEAQMVQDFGFILELIIEDIIDGVSDIGNAIGDLVGKVVEKLADKIEWEAQMTGKFLYIGAMIIDGIKDGIIDTLSDIYSWLDENVFTPIKEDFCELFGIESPSTVAYDWGSYIMQGLLNGITSKIDSVKEKFRELKEKVSTVMGDMRDKVAEIWQSMKNRIKAAINGIIGVINGMIKGVVAGINTLIRLLNNFSITLPSWLQYVPGASSLAGKQIAFNLDQIAAPQIPTLAQGAVIPPNREFMAILGDQTSGTNIEAPLDTIKQAVAEVMGANSEQMIQLLQQLIGVVESKNLVIGDKEIGKANARYVNQQKLIRGTAI